MNRPLLAVGIGLVTLGILTGVAVVATNDRWDDDTRVEYRVVDDTADGGQGSVVVIDDDRHRGPGFFPFFPLIIIGGVLITCALFSRGRGHHRHWDGRSDFEDWHRAAHSSSPGPGPSEPPAASPSA